MHCVFSAIPHTLQYPRVRVEGARDQLRGVPVVIRVQSSPQQVNLAVVVESISNASFNDLPPGEYLIQVTASGNQPAQMNVSLPFARRVCGCRWKRKFTWIPLAGTFIIATSTASIGSFP